MTNYQTICPFCERDPFHRVDNGVGMEAVAVTCCELGDIFFRGARPAPEEVTISWEEFRDIGCRLASTLRFASMPDREAIAKAIYSSWMDVAPDRASEHMAWFHDGESNPDSCVHYSNVAKAFDAADSILALTRAQRTDDQTS